MATATAVAGSLAACTAFADCGEMIARGGVDIVSVCTPDTLHRAPCEAAAAHGKHIFLEKPIASSLEDAEAIVRAVEAAGVRFGLGFLLRFDPRYALAREAIAAGRIGEVIHIYARRNSPRDEGPKRYGGKLPLALHVTIHDVDMVLWMLAGRRPQSVYAQAVNKLLGALGTDDAISAIVRFDDGSVVNFESAWVLPEGARSKLDAQMEIIGTEGAIEVMCGESGLMIADRSHTRYPDMMHWPSVGGAVRADLREQLQGFIDDIRTGSHTVASARDGLNSLRLVLAMMQSARSGKVVELQG
jgi:myo-inositol 2-dehydrogenase/D-chiro-inositol 1-dehydrogenase/UDP-N-acetylglucosamine 3-dehydrogenase